ncbi:MAG: HNH endonuclease [Caudoviricetes sp.]|nr:MAG: HNH endonuclease [Caudoviricetes sp.]
MKKKIIYDNAETDYSVTNDGKIYNDKTGRELKGTYARNEYHSVQLTINKKLKTFMVHRLVAEAFCENPNNYNIVDHIDRNKLNNDSKNLRWVSGSTNALNRNKKLICNEDRIKKFNITDFDSEILKETLVDNNYLVNKDGEVVSLKTQKYLLPSERNGYFRYNIGTKKCSAHILVWEAFNGEIPKGMVIDHIDTNRSNNKLSNLKLLSQKENIINAQQNGHKGQVSIKQYDKEGNFVREYSSIQKAADSIGVTHAAIRSASERKGTCKECYWIRSNQDFTIEELLKDSIRNKPRVGSIGVSKYSEKGEFLEHYSTLKKAGDSVSCPGSTISRAARNLRTGKGYYWILDTQDVKIEDII